MKLWHSTGLTEYREYRSSFIEKELRVITILSSCLLGYALLAPFGIHYWLNQSSWSNLLREFGTLSILILIPLVICIILRVNPTLKKEENTNLRGFLYDFTLVFLTVTGECVFPILSIYTAISEGRESGYIVFMLASLVPVSLFRLNPMTFLWTHCVCTACVIAVAKNLHIIGTDVTSTYNLIIFGLLIIILYCTKYKSEKHSYQKTKQIAKMQEDKEKFMVSLTHEMRTPLNAVLGKNQLILKDSGEEETIKLSKEINSSGKILLSLVNDILDYSKLESGKMNIVLSEYSFSQISDEVSDIMRSEAIGHGLKFIEDISEDIPKRFIGDSIRIKQIIMNLLSNAIKYTPSGSVTFRIRYTPEDNKNGILRIEVEDTGIGIKPEDIPKLEGEYVRIDEEKNRYVQGTGLGLSITSHLLSLMDSRLQIKSVYGKGSTFYFDLRQQVAENTESASEPVHNEPFDASRYNILVTDDNLVNFTVIRGFLKYFNVVPDYASSGDACIEKLTNKTYDIVFLDHMMPQKDGVATLNEIRTKLPDVRMNTVFIALTANYESDAEKYYKKIGFDGYLSKPIEMDKLNETLRKLNK